MHYLIRWILLVVKIVITNSLAFIIASNALVKTGLLNNVMSNDLFSTPPSI